MSSYTKSSWNSGTTITSAKMNNIENGMYNIYNATSAMINANSYGTNSVAIGNASTLANYAGAIAIGVNASSYTYHGIAIGIGANVSSNYGTALGGMTDISGYCGTALGYGANVYGNYSVAICYKANANGVCTLSLGYNSSAEENYAIAIGASSHSTNTYAISCGYNANSSGNVSIAFGPQSISNSYYSSTFGAFTRGYANYCTAVGYYAYCANANSIQLGNASYLSTLTCKVSLTTTSDERDKTDITEIDDGAVDFLNSIKAIRYVFNGRELYIDEDNLSEEDQEKRAKYGLCAYDTEAHDAGTKKGSRIRVGVSAQEVQAALESIYGDSSYANLVNDNLYDFDDVPDDVESQLAVNYDGFIPFLIKAIQELSDRILVLESEVAAIE